MKYIKILIFGLVCLFFLCVGKIFFYPKTAISLTQKPIDTLAILLSPFDRDFYEDCANKVIFPTNLFYDEMEITTKEAIITQDSGYFWIVAKVNRGKINLHIIGKKKGNILYQIEKKVNVIKPPKPQIITNLNGRIMPLDSLKVANDAIGSNLKIKIKPDSAFAHTCPKDCQYEFTEINVFLQNLLKERHRMGGKDLSGRNANKYLDFPFVGAFFRPVNESFNFVVKDIRRKKYDGTYQICTEFTEKEKEIVVRKKKGSLADE